MNRQETAIGNGSRWLMASVALDEPSLESSPVLVTEIFRCSMSAVQNRKSSMRAYVFRFAPESGLMSDIAPCPFRAITGRQLISRSLVGAYFLAQASRLYKQEAREVLV